MNKLLALLFAGLIISSLAVFFWLTPLSMQEIPGGQLSAREEAGKLVWEKQGCVECHSLFGNGGYSAQDLTRVTKRRSNAELRRFFADPPVLLPGKKKRHPGLTPESAEQVLAYLGLTARVNTLAWPPETNPGAKSQGKPNSQGKPTNQGKSNTEGKQTSQGEPGGENE